MTKALGTFRAFYLVALCCVGSFLFAYDTGIVGGILTFPSFQRDFRYTTKDKANVGSLSTSLLQAGGEYIYLYLLQLFVECNALLHGDSALIVSFLALWRGNIQLTWNSPPP